MKKPVKYVLTRIDLLKQDTGLDASDVIRAIQGRKL